MEAGIIFFLSSGLEWIEVRELPVSPIIEGQKSAP